MNATSAAISEPVRELLSIKRATQDDDLDRIAGVVNRAYQSRTEYLKNANRITSDEVRDLISDPQKKLYLGMSSTRGICGTLLVDFSNKVEKGEAEISLLTIDSDVQAAFQENNLASDFLESIEDRLFTFKKVDMIVSKIIVNFQAPLISTKCARDAFKNSLYTFYEDRGYQMRSDRGQEVPEREKNCIDPSYKGRAFLDTMQKKAPPKA